jgi:hypothetical protein
VTAKQYKSIDVRERHVTAFRKTTNLSRKALEEERQLLGSRSPSGGASGWVLFSSAPWSGFLEQPRFRRSLFFLRRSGCSNLIMAHCSVE